MTYAPGNPKPTVDQMAKDVSAFLVWTAEPKLENRHSAGLAVLIFLIFGDGAGLSGLPATSGPRRSARSRRSGRWSPTTRPSAPAPGTRRGSRARKRSMTSANDDLKALVRTIADFPKPGIQFRDITTLLLDSDGLRGHHRAARRQRGRATRSDRRDRGARVRDRRGARRAARLRAAADPQGRQIARRDHRRGLCARIWLRPARDARRRLRAGRAACCWPTI